MTDADLNSAAKALAEEIFTIAVVAVSPQMRKELAAAIIHRHFTAFKEQWEDGLAGTWWDDFNDLLAEVPKLRTELDAKEKRVKELEHTRRQMMDEALYYRELMRACGMQFCADCAWPIWPCKEHICGGKAVSATISQREYDALHTERNQLAEDKKRLDWLEAHPDVQFDCSVNNPHWGTYWHKRFGLKDSSNRFKSLREAIDTSLRAQLAKGGE